MRLSLSTSKRQLGVLAPLVAVAALACGSDPAPATHPAAAAGTGGGGGSAAAGPSCKAPEPAHLGDDEDVDQIIVAYVDQDGRPGDGVETAVCGTNICSMPQKSDGAGNVVVDATGIDFVNPRFNAGHDGRAYAKVSSLISNKPTMDFGAVRVFRLPGHGDGVEIEAGKESTQGGITLIVPADSGVEHDTLSFPKEQLFQRGLLVDITGYTEAELPGFDPALGIELVVAVMPLGTHICPGASLRFDNVSGWEAGREVDIYLNGAKTFKHYVPYGQWAKIAEAVVSADGMTVELKAGDSIEILGTFGAAPK